MIKKSLRARRHQLGVLLTLATVLLSLTGCYEPAVTITTNPTVTKAPDTPTAISVTAPDSPVPTPTTIAPQSSVVSTPNLPANSFSEVDNYIRDLMIKYDIPGAAIGLVKDSKVILTRGYGVRNINTGAPVTENTQFPIGSLTKSFTSLAIMQLVDQGKLDLDTPAVNYLPELKLANLQATQKSNPTPVIVAYQWPATFR